MKPYYDSISNLPYFYWDLINKSHEYEYLMKKEYEIISFSEGKNGNYTIFSTDTEILKKKDTITIRGKNYIILKVKKNSFAIKTDPGLSLDGSFLKIPKNVNLERMWSKIYDEFLDTFGLSQKYEEWQRMLSESVRLYTQVYLDGKRHLKPMAEIAERQADELMKELGGKDSGEEIASLSKYMGYRINPMKVTVKEIYGYIKLMNDENEQIKKQND